MTVIFLPIDVHSYESTICLQCNSDSEYLKCCKNINLLHMIIAITVLLFSHIHVRHIEPNWTCSWAPFTLVANRTVNAFAVHWTGRVKITTVPNQTEPGPVKITPILDPYRLLVNPQFFPDPPLAVAAPIFGLEDFSGYFYITKKNISSVMEPHLMAIYVTGRPIQ